MLFKKDELVPVADPNILGTSGTFEIGDYFKPGALMDDWNKAIRAFEFKIHVTQFF
jgi:hypothetical protein